MTMREVIAPETKSAQPKMSYEEFLQWADEDTHAEWVDGEVIIPMPPKDVHQTTLEFLHRLLGLFMDLLEPGKVRLAPFEVKLPGGSAREPDIFFIAKENLSRLTEERFVGPPDLIIEIVSKESVQRDRHDKFKEYRAAGVREYWIIDPRPNKQRADFFYLNDQGDYDLFATEEAEWVRSQVLPGFRLRPAWLWQADRLNPLTLFLAEMGGLPAEQVEQFRQMLRVNLLRTEDEE